PRRPSTARPDLPPSRPEPHSAPTRCSGPGRCPPPARPRPSGSSSHPSATPGGSSASSHDRHTVDVHTHNAQREPNVTRTKALGALSVAVTLAMAALFATPAGASSHREAPAISQDPAADNTDLYLFRDPV